MSSHLIHNIPLDPSTRTPVSPIHINTTNSPNSAIEMSVNSSPSPPLSLLYLALDSSGDKMSSRPRSKRASKGRVFQCTGYPDCNMLFTRSEHLARHKRKHTGERPFTCPHCSKNFSRLDNLRQHKQTVHAYETMIAVAHIPEIKNGLSSPESESAVSATVTGAPVPPPGMPSSVSSAPASLATSSTEMSDLTNGAPILPPPQLHRQHHMSNTLGKILSPPNGNGVLYQRNDRKTQNGQNIQPVGQPQNLQNPQGNQHQQQQHNNQQHSRQHNQQHLQQLQQSQNTPNNPNHQIYQYHIQQAYYPQSQYVGPLHYYPPVSYAVPPPLPSAPLPSTVPLFSSVAGSAAPIAPPMQSSLQPLLQVAHGAPLSATSSTTADSSPSSNSSNVNGEVNGASGSPPPIQGQSSETLKLPTSEFRPKRRPRPLELRYSFMASAPSLAETAKTPATASSALTTPTPSSLVSSLHVPSSVSTSHMHQDEVHGLKSAPTTSSFYSRTSIISPLSPLFHQLFHQVKQQPASSLSVENKENIGSAAALGTPGTGTGVVLPPVATAFSPLHIPPIRSSKNWLSGVLNGSSNGDAQDNTGQSDGDDMVVDGDAQVKVSENEKDQQQSVANGDNANAIKNEVDGGRDIDVDNTGVNKTANAEAHALNPVKIEDDNIEVDSVSTTAVSNGDVEKRLSIRNLLS